MKSERWKVKAMNGEMPKPDLANQSDKTKLPKLMKIMNEKDQQWKLKDGVKCLSRMWRIKGESEYT